MAESFQIAFKLPISCLYTCVQQTWGVAVEGITTYFKQ